MFLKKGQNKILSIKTHSLIQHKQCQRTSNVHNMKSLWLGININEDEVEHKHK